VFSFPSWLSLLQIAIGKQRRVRDDADARNYTDQDFAANLPNVTDASQFSLYEAEIFAKRYANAKSEKQLDQSFWRDFLVDVCGVSDLLAKGIEFQYPIRLVTTGNIGFADVFWPGVLLVEHKSAGFDLDKAEKQARDYLLSLDNAMRPPVFIVSDFARIRIVDVFAGTTFEFSLNELPQHLPRVEAVLGKDAQSATKVQVSADARAASLMSELFVAFEQAGYEGHEVSVFLVRTLFILFAEDAGMLKRVPNGLFGSLVHASAPDGSGLGATIQELFGVLNTPKEARKKTIATTLSNFPYVNGGLFSELLTIFSFSREMREALLEACAYDWSQISPAIFGAMFQTIKSKEDRRELGEHYTSEANIMKLISPLFLNELNTKLLAVWDSKTGLKRFQEELGSFNFLDPACGCGNFLLVAYKRLRDLELKAIARIKELDGTSGKLILDGTWDLSVSLSQFHGIEYEEWPSQIATVAMFLADHQANITMEQITGAAPDLLPLRESAQITHGNALDLDWAQLCPMSEKTIILGNPPFYGARWQSAEQKEETLRTWSGVRGSGNLDYVSNWFIIASRHIASTAGRAAFVATNSLTQGIQPGLIWGQLEPLGIGIDFAHRTFAWSNGDPGEAAVHCVIIGFSARPKNGKRSLWTYATPKSEPRLTKASNINAYLLNAPNILISSRSIPLSPNLPKMEFGSMPNDGGFLSNISQEEANEIKRKDPLAGKYLRKLMGAQELIHNEERYCLWLEGANPSDIAKSAELKRRVEAVRDLREASKREATRKLGKVPTLFGEIRQPKSEYIAIPSITSELREYVPITIFGPEIILNNKVNFIRGYELEAFGVLSSRPFNVWNKAVSGRTKNDTLISISITYNNFPFPKLSAAQAEAIERAADLVLISREHFLGNSLADLYNPNSMPPQLREAHQNLDKAVLSVYGLKVDATDEEILSALFALHSQMTGGLFTPPDQDLDEEAA
jgi:hypothetical protein